MQQQALMKFDPATGVAKPYPSHAAQWRKWHGEMTAWLFDPWTGRRRDAREIGSDVQGLFIIHPGEPVYAATLGHRHAGCEMLNMANVESKG